MVKIRILDYPKIQMGQRAGGGGLWYIAFIFLKEEALMMNEFSMLAMSASPADKQMPN